MPTITTEAKVENLGSLLAFVEDACHAAGAAQSDVFAFRLVADEVCTNIIHYGYGEGGGPITLSFDRDGRAMTLTVGDNGTPFDPEDAPAPDTTSSWEERKIGGLGLHLVKAMMDEVHYESRPGEGNSLRLVKHAAEGPCGEG